MTASPIVAIIQFLVQYVCIHVGTKQTSVLSFIIFAQVLLERDLYVMDLKPKQGLFFST